MSHRDHAHHHHSQSQPAGRKPIHKDWRTWTWVALVLMLAGIAAYVMTMDESLPPGGGVQPTVPAAP